MWTCIVCGKGSDPNTHKCKGRKVPKADADLVKDLAKLHQYVSGQIKAPRNSPYGTYGSGKRVAYEDVLAHLEAIMERIQ